MTSVPKPLSRQNVGVIEGTVGNDLRFSTLDPTDCIFISVMKIDKDEQSRREYCPLESSICHSISDSDYFCTGYLHLKSAWGLCCAEVIQGT